jgi:LysM repeat protein/ABC-type branched-subunit amino acid transport system substrate-binding protein
VKNVKPGEVILVPEMQQPQQKPSGMNLRRVAKGETLFSLAREYNVTIDEILAANDGLPGGLKENTFIKIPIYNRTETPAPQQTDSQSQPADGTSAAAINSKVQQEPLQQQKPESNYFEFQSRKNETLYELALHYRISIDSLMAFNPGVSMQLSLNQIIKIPFSSIKRDYITHSIKERISVNRLARLYNLDADKIKEINPFISRQLQPGQTIRIPLPKLKDAQELDPDSILADEEALVKPAHDLSQKDFCNQLNEKGTYNIALMIPFFFSQLTESQYTPSESSGQNYGSTFIKPFLFIQFYEGLLLAVDSLKQIGLNAEIHIFNVEDNITQAHNVLDDPLLKKMDLIIGPFYSSSFNIVANFARKHKIPVVNPLTTRSDVLAGNPFVVKILPDEDRMLSALTDFLNQKHRSSQIFIARHHAIRDEEMINNLKSALEDDLSLTGRSFTNIYHEIIYSQDNLSRFNQLASPKGENVVIIYSDNKVFVLDIMRKLNQLREEFNITVIGLPNWMDIEELDYHHMNNLNTHVISAEYADYSNQQVKNFVLKFRENYHAEPEKYAFKGFDTGIFFLSAMMKYGAQFTDCVPYHKIPLLYGNYRFSSTKGNGFENQEWKVLRLEDYKFREIILH